MVVDHLSLVPAATKEALRLEAPSTNSGRVHLAAQRVFAVVFVRFPRPEEVVTHRDLVLLGDAEQHADHAHRRLAR